MFSGLVQDIGEIRQIDGCNITIATKIAGLKIGDSIACDGCCLTVVELNDGEFCVQVSPETISKTTIGAWSRGDRVNLEPCLKVGDEIGGHFVSGHIDGIAEVIAINKVDEFYKFTIKADKDLMPLIAKKGSVALCGVSLTINDVFEDSFDVMIIPHTMENTTFGFAAPMQQLHIEVDLLARYAARILEAR